MYNYVGGFERSVCKEEGEVQELFMRAHGSSKKIKMDKNSIKKIKEHFENTFTVFNMSLKRQMKKFERLKSGRLLLQTDHLT